MSSDLDIFADTAHGRAALKKLGVVPEGFRFYCIARLGRAPEFSDAVKLSGATFRKVIRGKNKQALLSKVGGSEVDVYVTDGELTAMKNAERYTTWRDLMSAEDQSLHELFIDSLPDEVGVTRRPTAAELDFVLDKVAEIAKAQT